jgi:hypothetical protein
LNGDSSKLQGMKVNDLQTWATDIGNAYLEVLTSEKVSIIAGPEFGNLQGHVMIIYKALYGLRSSGARWQDRFSDCLRAEGFFPCKAEQDIWMRPKNGVYEYIAVYVNDLAIAMADPPEFVDVLEKKHKFKLKGAGTIAFHLGCDFFCDDEGILCMAPKKYIEKMMMGYQNLFGEKPSSKVHSPLEKGDHPESVNSELLDETGVQQYQYWVSTDTIFKLTGRQHANPDGESATNQATKTWRQKVCQQHNNQPLNAGVSPQVQKGTVGLNQHFSLPRVSLS